MWAVFNINEAVDYTDPSEHLVYLVIYLQCNGGESGCIVNEVLIDTEKSIASAGSKKKFYYHWLKNLLLLLRVLGNVGQMQGKNETDKSPRQRYAERT